MAPLRHWHCPGMGGFCRQNSLENPLPRQEANVFGMFGWNPSLFERVGMRDPKYPSRSMANTTVDSVNLNLNFI
jgi:hypothetical protein